MITQKEGTRWFASLYIAAVCATVFGTDPVRAEVLDKTSAIRGTTVHYKVVLPSGYDPSKVYPAILALGGGAQTMNTVDGVLNRYLRAEAEKRGYIVIAPAAPDDHLVLWDGAEVFPEFFKKILADYKIENGKFHIAGPSNGGIAALEIAAAHPEYFLSITAFPGYLVEPRERKLKAISKMCVFLYVGELDDDVWHIEMKKEADTLRSMGAAARYIVEKGQAHGIQTLAGNNAGRLFDGFEESKKGCSN
jgi:poly(3-hydroxybutyrate) depolymerase